ncbi:hypothetical protein BURKHO8Y_580029 [Burkholderia sp. 8Y]|nr:hypothetical protein BURKHO8Y_580029 [Burkholderia sp. 8Y]
MHRIAPQGRYGPLLKNVSFAGISGNMAFTSNGERKDLVATFYKVVGEKWGALGNRGGREGGNHFEPRASHDHATEASI